MDQYFFKTPFATAGDVAAIPRASQPSGDVSFTDGFTADYSLPNSDPSVKKVPRDKSNQLYFAITENLQQYQTFGTPEWITAANNDGVSYSYSTGARVKYSGAVWVSLADTNTATPSTDPTKWKLASTVETRGASYGGVVSITSTPYTLLSANVGYIHTASSSANVITMPAIAGLNDGDTFNIVNYTSSDLTINRDGSSTFAGTNVINGSTTSLKVSPYSSVSISRASASTWNAIGIQGSQSERVLAAGSIGSVSNLAFVLSTLDPGQSANNFYLLRLNGFQPASNDVTLFATFSADGGSTYASTAYYSAVRGDDSTSSSITISGANLAQGYVAGGSNANEGFSSAANAVGAVDIHIMNFNTGASVRPITRSDAEWWSAGSRLLFTSGTVSNTTAADYDALKLTWEGGGNFATVGTYVLYKLARPV